VETGDQCTPIGIEYWDVEARGLEPLTSALQRQRSTN
jgi:hypothetical protein